MSEHAHVNRLAGETSPYLLQHAHNPVDWYPWGQEALRRAAIEDKPILLSIGYSACHWCHVMERESFENEAVARIMNEHFVNVKVDREERPDLDAIYMEAVQMMTGHGGWPMTVFLTPDGFPFYGGTYFPPEDRHGLPGFARVLLGVARAYAEKRDQIREDAAMVLEELRRQADPPCGEARLDISVLDTAAEGIMRGYDHRNGGFGTAPKFPPSMALTFLLRSYFRTGKPRYLEAVEQTLEKMGCGGIYDQLGGGFHRYSVDAGWLVPHFEKMLCDNALLSRIYLDAYRLTGKPFYRRIVEETLDYVIREMTSPEGGFYSSQDADSEGQEGKFFLWGAEEVNAALGEHDGELFCRYFDVTQEGHFEGRNILNVPRAADLVARLERISEERLRDVILHGRQELFRIRERRVRPARDEKVLAAWNGLMLRSFAEAASALDRADFLGVAERNARFLLSRMKERGRLLRSYKDGKARYNAYLEDYAFIIDGLISLYQATFAASWLAEAGNLAKTAVDLFRDFQGGGFHFTSSDHEPLIHRPKDYSDNAIPSGNSAAAFAFLRLGRLRGEEEWAEHARSVLEATGARMARYPHA
ncbi:MAG: thioredoxin domain-containing protein, partial [Acidobacteria bacterium]|nr:thioredoxin domain-containing protein [Acidobacteriota bacterium]